MGLLSLRRLRLLSFGLLRLSLRYNDNPYDSYDYNTQNPYSYYSGYAAPSQGSNAVVGSVQSQLSKLWTTAARSTELLETEPRPLSPVINRTMT